MVTQLVGNCRNDSEKFYTNPKIVSNLCEKVTKKLLIRTQDVIIEPSAGNGAFIKDIKSIGCSNVLFYDIEPENDEVIKQDFLTLDILKDDDDLRGIKRYHIIGNPPFGRNCCLAIKFIKKATSFADTISFILPKSFKKDSMKIHFDLHFHLKYEKNLDPNSFLVNGMKHNVECVFQIWEKQVNERAKPKFLTTDNIKFVKKYEKHDISFTRVGDKAGYITSNKSEKQTKGVTSNYFILFSNRVNIEKQIDVMKGFRYKSDNTCTLPSISQQEIIFKILKSNYKNIFEKN
jgi:predicted RNA methylase